MVTKEFMEKYRWALEESHCKGNINALDQVEDPNLVLHMPPYPDVKGLAAAKQGTMGFLQGFTNWRVEFEEMISEGDNIACRCTWYMKHTGTTPVLPIPPTNKEVALRGSLLARVKNGKIVEEFMYNDNLGWMQQLGVVPPMGQK